MANNLRFVCYKGETEYYLSLDDILFFETEEKEEDSETDSKTSQSSKSQSKESEDNNKSSIESHVSEQRDNAEVRFNDL